MIRKLLPFLAVFSLFLFCLPAYAQFTYGDCTTPANTSIGGGWTINQCLPWQNADGDPTTLSDALPYAVSAGHLLIVNTAQSGSGARTLTVTDSLKNVASGTVNTSGSTVTFVSGLPFSTNGCVSGAKSCTMVGTTIRIPAFTGTSYTVTAVNSFTSLTVSPSPGTQSGVTYSASSWYCTETEIDPQSAATNTCMAFVQSGGTDTITLTSAGSGSTGQYSLEFGATEISNTNGIVGLDNSACLYTNCNPTQGYPPGQTTVGSDPATASQTVNLSGTNELVYINYSCGIGPVGTTSGWAGLIIGVLGASSSNYYCDNGNGYCPNEPQSEAKVATSSGSFKATVDDGSSNDFYMMQVLAFQPGSSAVSEQTASPSFNPAPGSYGGAQSVSLSDATQNATIYYTTDGSAVSTSSPVYSSPVAVNTTTTIKSMAVAPGYSNSSVATGAYTIGTQASTPTFSPVPGSYGSAQSVTISDTTSGATVNYTTDGSTPTSSSPVYSNPVNVGTSLTLKAIASASGDSTSPVVSGSYVITNGNDLVGWWKFDEGSGTTAADSTGDGYTATLFNGISWVTGKIGDAVSANGTNQYVGMPTIDLSGTSAVTIAAWVNRTYSTAGGHTLLEDSANFNSSTTGFGLFPDDNTCQGIMAALNGNVGYSVNCYAQPSSGAWHHIAVVYDKTKAGSSAISLYIDGVLQPPTQEPDISTNTNAFGNNPIYLFARGGSQQYSTGIVDDLRLYDEALSAAQIQQIYQSGLPTLASIAVTPANASIAKGATQQYTATGTYSDGSTQNLTTSASWVSTNTGTATISKGLADGVAAGSTTIQATSGSISGSTGLTVNAPVLASIAVTPSNPSIAAGNTQQFTATGTYSDGSQQNLTSSASWSSSNTAIATISSGGLATGVAAGSATITATSGSVSNSTGITVTSSQNSQVSNLLAYWAFNDGTGTTAADSSGNGHTATLANGVSWVKGESGDAVSANGSNQYVSIPVIDFSGTDALTVSAWVNRTYSTSGGHTLWENSTNFNNSTTGFGLYPDDNTCNGIMVGLKGNGGYSINCFAQPSSGAWHHLVAVYDKSQPGSSEVKLYIDGQLQTPTANLYTHKNTNNFGKNPAYLFSRGGTQEFNAGIIDELRIYSGALSAAQVQQLP